MPRPFYSPALPGLVAASVDETKSVEIPLHSAVQVGGSLRWGTGVTAGKVVFEISPIPADTGIWEEIFARDFVADGDTAASSKSFTYPGPFSGHGRWRIDATVTGGTVTTDTQVLVN